MSHHKMKTSLTLKCGNQRQAREKMSPVAKKAREKINRNVKCYKGRKRYVSIIQTLWQALLLFYFYRFPSYMSGPSILYKGLMFCFVNRCLGLPPTRLTKGNCASIDPCEPSPCAADEKWVVFVISWWRYVFFWPLMRYCLHFMLIIP